MKITSTYKQLLLWCLVGLLGLLASGGAQAQSGPVGNEWIVAGQTYYKLQLARTGLYRLDYQYLTQAGITGVSPGRMQLWRRGKEVAIFVGGNGQALDATTYLEFYGQRNDGQLDKDFYKSPTDQAHQLYSYYTDTASYFLTWTAGAVKRMAQPVASGGTLHPHRLANAVTLRVENYADGENSENDNFQPWLDKGEGYFTGTISTSFAMATDSVQNTVATTGPAPRLEVLVVGSSVARHITQVYVVPPSGTARLLDTLVYSNYGRRKRTFAIQRSDIGSNGRVTVQFTATQAATGVAERFRVAYVRTVVPQTNRWYTARRHVLFQNDSTLAGGPATYELDSIPAAVNGYDVTDPYNVQRVLGTAGSSATKRQFAFASAVPGTTRWLLLAGDRPYVPFAAQRVTFRTIDPTQPNFLIITSGALMGPATSAAGTTVASAAREYASYRASATGGGYTPLLMTSAEAYDQFHYGEKSALGVRHLALWIANSGAARAKYLLLLGNGALVHANVIAINGSRPYFRNVTPAQVYTRDYVPTSGRAESDSFFTSDWHNGNLVPAMYTGRLAVMSAQAIMNYLDKLKAYETAGEQAWRKNVVDLVGGETATESQTFREYLANYRLRIQSPLFGGQVVSTYDRSLLNTANKFAINIKIDNELNAGLGIINYFGHGSPSDFDVNIGDPNDAANNYNNLGRYPIMIYNGCAAATTFRSVDSNSPGNDNFLQKWMFAPNKGAIGFLGETGFSYPYQLNVAQDLIYQLLLNDPAWYGKPIAVVQAEAIRRLQGQPLYQNPIGVEQLMCTMWHGDPALTLFAPEKPDFIASNSALSISPIAPNTEVTANSATFTLNVGVSNPGKVTTDPLEIRVTRSYGGTTRKDEVYNQTFAQSALPNAVYAFIIPNTIVNGVNVFGNNTFTVELNPNKKPDELSFANNTAAINYTFLQGGVTILAPTEFAIVPTHTPRLVAQTNDPNAAARLFNMELDTVATFNSPLRQTHDVTAPLLVDWRPTLPEVGRDSVVWYWRVRFAVPGAGEDSRWATSSFRVINNFPVASGWSQSHYAQLQRSTLSGASVAAPNGHWTFDAQNTRATVTSPLIGPAQEWKTLQHWVATTNATGRYSIKIIGVDASGTATVLNAAVPSSRFSLASISATDYPYLQLQLSVADTNRVAPQLREWLITYTGVPEGIVRRDLVPAVSYDATTLQQQAATAGQLTFPVKFENVSTLPFGTPLRALIEVYDSNTSSRLVSLNQVVSATALQPDAVLTVPVTVPLTGKFGTLTTRVTLNPLPVATTDPKALPELYHFNNELNLDAFKVSDTSTPPVLDVAFDGRHILNGELVGPRPVVTIQLTDTDMLRHIKSASAFTVTLAGPTGTTSAVNVLGSNVTFTVDSTSTKGSIARLEYSPGQAAPLADGIYTLQVQGRNATNLAAGTQTLQVKFEVVNASQITNVYPYPNPVTSKARFVFTVTGQELPRNMKIQIMTLTGRVVREIFMGELGNIHLGNNLTDYAWDGTDQYGDRLANGTYLYRVSLDDPSGQFSKRATGGDQAFKNDWGKLVLLR